LPKRLVKTQHLLALMEISRLDRAVKMETTGKPATMKQLGIAPARSTDGKRLPVSMEMFPPAKVAKPHLGKPEPTETRVATGMGMATIKSNGCLA
jgi:hypothetical protein